MSETEFPRMFFRCIVCGAEGWNKDWVRYAEPDKHIRSKAELLKSYKSPEHIKALKESKEEYFYEFTVCHGIFVRDRRKEEEDRKKRQRKRRS